jgi:hypothetical protein
MQLRDPRAPSGVPFSPKRPAGPLVSPPFAGGWWSMNYIHEKVKMKWSSLTSMQYVVNEHFKPLLLWWTRPWACPPCWCSSPSLIVIFLAFVKLIDCRCEDGCFLASASCVTIANPALLSSNETGVNPGIRSWKKNPSLMAWLSSKLRSHWWYPFHKKSTRKSWDATTWFIIWQFQTPTWKQYLQSHLLAERFVFWWWWSGFSERRSQDLSNGTNVASITHRLWMQRWKKKLLSWGDILVLLHSWRLQYSKNADH